MQTEHHSFIPDPELSTHSGAIDRKLRTRAETLSARDLQSLLETPIRDAFQLTMASVNADSGAMWLVNAERTALTMAFCPAEPALVGTELPLDEGLISLVVASENSLCENEVYEHAQHSKRVDQLVGKTTQSMIATPLYAGGVLCGVLSCVKWKETERALAGEEIFTAADLKRVQSLAALLDPVISHGLLRVLLDL